MPLPASRRYLLISPCRDAAQYLRRRLDSVAAQSVPPALWVVVDDGSTDETPAILEELGVGSRVSHATTTSNSGASSVPKHSYLRVGKRAATARVNSERA